MLSQEHNIYPDVAGKHPGEHRITMPSVAGRHGDVTTAQLNNYLICRSKHRHLSTDGAGLHDAVDIHFSRFRRPHLKSARFASEKTDRLEKHIAHGVRYKLFA
jgi:hypothetical protein